MSRNMYLCPKCKNSLNLSNSEVKCENCENETCLMVCGRKNCKFILRSCLFCYSEEFRDCQSKENEPQTTYFTGNKLIMPGVVLLCALLWFGSKYFPNSENKDALDKLKEDFPSQRDETWSHFLSVLEKNPTVKSIIFLHDGDKRTSDCLANSLVSLYSGNKSIQSKDITFSAAGFEERDYGFALVHYHSVVEKHRVLVTDLTKISGNLARIFQSLCDEYSSDIKPSLFIFTLKYDKQTKMLKPSKRAKTILKEAWSNLSENEIFPLLPRVIKNVVDVVPEKSASCKYEI